MKTLLDKVVVITGAGSGIGRALALEAAARGATVAISDVNEAGAEATRRLVTDAGGRAVADRIDVADREAVLAYADEVAVREGGVDVVINNAGVTMTGDFEEMTLEDFDWILGINLNGVVNGTKAFLPHLIASGDGHVANVSSVFGFVSMGGQSAYNASKFAVRGFTEALRQEMLANGHPVGVTCVHPGAVRTGILRNGRSTASHDADGFTRLFEETLARTEPDQAARIIIRAILHDKARVLVGLDAHVVHHAAKLLGSRYQDVLVAGSKRFLPAKVR